MNRIFLMLSLLLGFSCYPQCANRPPLVIAVVDSGFGYQSKGSEAKLCKVGHQDFTSEQKFYNVPGIKVPVPLDLDSHGTNIVGIIESYLKPAHINYCIVILKFYSHDGKNEIATVRAFS